MATRVVNFEKKRSQIVFYFLFFLFFILTINLFKIQVLHGSYYKKIAFEQHLCWLPMSGLRGKILGRNKEILALSLHLYSVGANPKLIKSPEEVADKLSNVLSVSRNEILKSLKYKDRELVWLERKISDETLKEVEKLNLEGISVQKEDTGKRFYPNHKLACHILGYTGIDDQGLDGIEGIYENYLVGKPGSLKFESDNFGRALPNGQREIKPSSNGCDIVLTIDKFIQYIAETELQKAVLKHKARGGSVVVMDPQTGEILALANYPSFDINRVSNTSKDKFRNSAICDSYEPGSTFKVILAAAAIDSGKVSLNDAFPCGNCVQVGGWTIYNANDGLGSENGYENIKEIIKYSFNTGSASIGMKIGKKTYYDYIKKFGFGNITGIELPGETEGIVISPDNWSNSSLATIAFGQGISVTPIQLTRAVAAIANGGKLLKPLLIKEIINSEGQVIKTFEPKVEAEILKPSTTETMIDILEGVVADGTGKKAQIPGYNVAGKTGTAQVVEKGIYSPNKYIASFIGFVPSRNPKLIILVKIDVPRGVYWGGYVAGPVFREIAREALLYMGVPGDKNSNVKN